MLCCCLYKIQAQPADTSLQLKLLTSIAGTYSDFTVDNLGNLYLISATKQIKKLSNKFDSVGLFNDVKRYGDIYCLDATNPLKILVFYKDFQTIVVLDRFLNAVNTIDLRKQNIVQVKAVTLSYDNNIWLFDELDAKIKKLDDNGKVLLSSTDFRMLFDTVPNPTQLIDRDGQLYLYNKAQGFNVFDYYGAKQTHYTLLNWQDVQVSNGFLIGHDANVLFKAKPQQLFLKQFQLGKRIGAASKIMLLNERLYVLVNGQLQVFQLTIE